MITDRLASELPPPRRQETVPVSEMDVNEGFSAANRAYETEAYPCKNELVQRSKAFVYGHLHERFECKSGSQAFPTEAGGKYNGTGKCLAFACGIDSSETLKYQSYIVASYECVSMW